MHHGMFHGSDVVGRDAQGHQMSDSALPALVQLKDTIPQGTGIQISLAMSVGIEADHTM